MPSDREIEAAAHALAVFEWNEKIVAAAEEVDASALEAFRSRAEAALSAAAIARPDPDECRPNPWSSAVCSRGTKCCEVDHPPDWEGIARELARVLEEAHEHIPDGSVPSAEEAVAADLWAQDNIVPALEAFQASLGEGEGGQKLPSTVDPEYGMGSNMEPNDFGPTLEEEE